MQSKFSSQTITALRFPLIVAVVMLHTYIIDKPIAGHIYVKGGQFPIFDLIEHLFRVEIANMAVPLFFFISGYLFFGDISFSKKTYQDKLKRRFFSLFIPYIFWNTVFMLFIAGLAAIYPTWLVEKKSMFSMNLTDFFNAFWNLNQGLIPLWFIRDLMVLNLLAPLLYRLLKRFGILFLSFMCLLWLCQIGQWIPGIGVRASFFYAFGAWFSIHKLGFIEVLSKFEKQIYLISISLIFLDTYLWSKNVSYSILFQLSQIIGSLAIALFVSRLLLLNRIKPNAFLAESSFFVFVFHMFIIKLPTMYWVRILPINTFTATGVLFVIPILTSLTCVIIYKCINSFFPHFAGVIMGRRKQ